MRHLAVSARQIKTHALLQEAVVSFLPILTHMVCQARLDLLAVYTVAIRAFTEVVGSPEAHA